MPEIGVTIALAHYLSSFVVGIIFRFHGRDRDVPLRKETSTGGNILLKAFRALYKARQEDGRSIGKLLGDSVKSSMNTILLIGGFIMLFAVFIRILGVIGVTGLMTGFVEAGLAMIGFSVNLAPAIVSGIFEIDIGTLAASKADAPLSQKVAVAGAIIAWSGLSVHGQVASIVVKSGIRMTPFIIARFIHAVIAGIFTILLWEYAHNLTSYFTVPVMHNLAQPTSLTFWLIRFEQVFYQMLIVLGILAAVAIAVHIIRGLFSYARR
jgi:sporulation integral membrane protein YlbJ